MRPRGKSAQKFAGGGSQPLATEAGYQMLKQGGAAIDAAIATQLVLTLVEPQSSGIGGGAFLLYSDGKRVQSYDGRETAPAAADEHLFQDADGKPVSRETGVIGGRSVGAPGGCACWKWRTRSMAACRGKRCSRQPSSWPKRVSKSARA
jgi:gamma-glutamyltranspeptidase/glutathione hydrolase